MLDAMTESVNDRPLNFFVVIRIFAYWLQGREKHKKTAEEGQRECAA
jgi:hypothetical protein